MGQAARHAIPLADLWLPAGRHVEQCAGGASRRRRRTVAWTFFYALGIVGQSSLRPSRDIVGDLDLAALARVPSYAARHESRGRPALSRRYQSTHRTWMA